MIRVSIGKRIYTEKERKRVRSDVPGYVWQWFTDLESLAIKYTYYIPLDVHLKEADNRKVWSPALASMLVNAGGIIDSFFRAAIFNPTFDKVNLSKTTPKLSIEQLRSNPGKANIAHYRELFEQVYQISQLKVLVNPNQRSPLVLYPFREFEKGKSPYWWQEVYNKLKHERLSNPNYIRLATISTVLDCLSGLFLLQLLYQPCREHLIEIGVIRSKAHWTMMELSSNLKNQGWKNIDELIAARSKLFGFLYHTKATEQPITKETKDTYVDHPEEVFHAFNPVGYDTWRKAR